MIRHGATTAPVEPALRAGWFELVARKPARSAGSTLLALLVFLAGPAIAPAQTPVGSSGAPAENWEMKIFTNEGYRSMILRGTEVRVGPANRFDVVDLNITEFSGTADSKVESILLSPVATYFARENRAHGDKSVRLIREDMEITGERWTCLLVEKKVSIQKNSRVVFHAQLPDLLQ